jgi:hypothetical protein
MSTTSSTNKVFFGEPQMIPITIKEIRRGMGILQYQGRLEKSTYEFHKDWFENCYKRPLTKKEASDLLLLYEQAKREFYGR